MSTEMNNKSLKSKYKVYLLWLVLSLPGFGIIIGSFLGKISYSDMMHSSGELAARFLIISLVATPLAMLFPKSNIPKWLLRNRRFFGVAAFAYTLLHTIFYVLEVSVIQAMEEAFTVSLFTGWVAFFIFIPLAATSTDAAIKRMKKKWKALQRWVYLAAFMTFLHWVFIDIDQPHWAPALIHFSPVTLLSIYRLWHYFRPQHQVNVPKY